MAPFAMLTALTHSDHKRRVGASSSRCQPQRRTTSSVGASLRTPRIPVRSLLAGSSVTALLLIGCVEESASTSRPLGSAGSASTSMQSAPNATGVPSGELSPPEPVPVRQPPISTSSPATDPTESTPETVATTTVTSNASPPTIPSEGSPIGGAGGSDGGGVQGASGSVGNDAPEPIGSNGGSGGEVDADDGASGSSGGPNAEGDAENEPTPIEPNTLWLAGDSTVANGNTPCPVGWGKRIAEYFDDSVTVVNSAVGGRSVRTWTYFVTTEMDEATNECVLERDGAGEPLLQERWLAMLDGMQTGDTLLIQFGINDGSATCDRHVGLEAFVETYGVLAESAKERGAQPVFITPVSMVKCSGSQSVGSRGGYVDATFEAGNQFDVPVLDLHQASVDLYQELGFCPIPGGDVSAQTGGAVGAFFCDDHTHFDDGGAQQIADLVATGLAELGLPIADHLR